MKAIVAVPFVHVFGGANSRAVKSHDRELVLAVQQ